MKKSKKLHIFESSVERLARMLAEKWDIKVVFKHGACYTNGKKITLPTLPEDADDYLFTVAHGQLDHEAAHCVFSDFDVLKKHVKKALFKPMLNALEDPRIERKWCGIYPGSARHFEKLYQWAEEENFKEIEIEDPITGQVQKTTTWDTLSEFGKLTHAIIHYTKNGFSTDSSFFKTVNMPELEQLVRENDDLLRKAFNADDTQSLEPIVQELLDRLGLEDYENPEGEGESEDNEDNENGDGEGEGQALEGRFVDSDGNDNNFKGGKIQLPTPEQLKNDQKASAQEHFKDQARKAVEGSDSYLVYTTEGDIREVITSSNSSAYVQFRREANRYVSVMKRKISRSLLSVNEARWDVNKARGQINSRVLYQVPLGIDEKVFRQRQEVEALNTAVLLMIDHSYSMAGSQLDLAAKTSVVFGELLNSLNIPFSAIGFSTGDQYISSERYNGADSSERELFDRWGNLWIGEYKKFEDTWRTAAPRMLTMRNQHQVNTYDGEALRYGAQILMARPEKRKIMFWLNDGSPCPNPVDDHDKHYQYAKECAKEVESMVELVAVGIQTNAVNQLYSNCIVVNDLKDLPTNCLGQLSTLLRAGKRGHKPKRNS